MSLPLGRAGQPMCSCGCNPPTSPSSGSGPAAPAAPGTAPCSTAQSAIQVVDELGIPLRNQPVKLTLSTGGVHYMTTDANGYVCLNLPPNTTGQVEVANTHEARQGDSTTTPSGQHFKTNGTGP